MVLMNVSAALLLDAALASPQLLVLRECALALAAACRNAHNTASSANANCSCKRHHRTNAVTTPNKR